MASLPLGEPGREVARVIRAWFEFGHDAEVCAKEAAPKFGDHFLARAFATILAVPAEIPIDAVGRSGPVNVMPISA
jgi:hypothetical protein